MIHGVDMTAQYLFVAMSTIAVNTVIVLILTSVRVMLDGQDLLVTHTFVKVTVSVMEHVLDQIYVTVMLDGLVYIVIHRFVKTIAIIMVDVLT